MATQTTKRATVRRSISFGNSTEDLMVPEECEISRPFKRIKRVGSYTSVNKSISSESSKITLVRTTSSTSTTCSTSATSTAVPSRSSTPLDSLSDAIDIYKYGRRSYQIIETSRSAKKAPISVQLITMASGLVHAIWENGGVSTERDRKSRKSLLTNYILSIILKVNPLPTTVMAALLYLQKLRRMYPKAKGEPGCGVRLFLVAFMVAIKYWEICVPANTDEPAILCSPVVIDDNASIDLSLLKNGNCSNLSFQRSAADIEGHSLHEIQTWLSIGGVFTASELAKMELEFLTFLKCDLFIKMTDLEYFSSRLLNTQQSVPECGFVFGTGGAVFENSTAYGGGASFALAVDSLHNRTGDSVPSL